MRGVRAEVRKRLLRGVKKSVRHVREEVLGRGVREERNYGALELIVCERGMRRESVREKRECVRVE